MFLRQRSRALLALAATAAVVAGILTPQLASAAPADAPQLTPELRLDPTGGNPCLGASPAAMAAIHCVGRLLDPQPVSVPSDLIAPEVSSDIKKNCTPGFLTSASPSTGIGVTVASAHTTSSTTENYGGKWDMVGGSITVGGETGFDFIVKGTAKFEVTATYSHTWVSGWSQSWTTALQKTYTVQHPYEQKIPAYHWSVSTFSPRYERIRVLWTWDEPDLTKQRPGVRAGAVETIYLPATTSDGTADGTWDVRMVPMSPAEIEACATPQGPAVPVAVQADLAGPAAGRYLDELPTMFSQGPLTAPVLTQGAGTATAFQSRAVLVNSRTQAGTTYDALDHSLQLTGDSQVGFWTAGQCTAFTARVGYGRNLKIDAPGIARDTLELWSGRVDHGQIVEVERLASQLVPVAPADFSSDANVFQARVSADLKGAAVLILKTVRGAGSVDPLSGTDPGVVIGDPHIDCAGSGPTVLRSRYTGAVSEYTLHLAGTPEQIAADPTRYRAPDLVENGWQCNNQPESLKPRTIVGQSCGGNPLRVNGQEFTAGIGAHSGTADAGSGAHSAAKIRWEHLPPTCTTLSFGVGFDDEVPATRANHTVSVRSALYDAPTGGVVEQQVLDTVFLNGDGRDGIKLVNLDTIGLGSRRIELGIDASSNGNGHVDVVNPVLTCRTQPSTVSSVTPTPASDADSVLELPISQMTLNRATNYWGPVEVDMSLGESEARDGRPVAPQQGSAFSIGGASGWSSGFGVAPGSWERSQIEVLTKGACQRISSWVGIDDEIGRNGSARFTILADGRPVAQSEVMRGGQQAQLLMADVSNADTVTLSVDNAGDGTAYDHADWAEPTLVCTADPTHARSIPASSQPLLDAVSHWGPVEKNSSLGEAAAGDGRPMQIGSFAGFNTGFGVAPSSTGADARISLIVPEGCTRFSTWVGVDAEVGARGSVQFWIWTANENTVWSPIMRGGDDPQLLTAKVHPGTKLILTTDNASDSNAWDHADWADPTFFCS